MTCADLTDRPAEGNITPRAGVPPLVSARNVSKSFATAPNPVQALDDVSLDIRRNEFLTLLGPSGCGKTTLLRLLAGFERPDAGTLVLEDRDVRNDPPNRRPINMVFQSYALFPHLSVARNIAFGLEQLGLDRQFVTARVAAMLQLVRLGELADRKPAQLSGGQQQRVALARALAPSPKLLLLDEPLSALDRKLRLEMQIELKRMQRETGITFLLVTHDQDEALSMSDRIAIMNEGHIVQVGAPRSLYDRPRTRFVADFMGANIVPGALFGRPDETVAIRPEQVLLARHGDGMPGRVVTTTYSGATFSTLVTLDQACRINVVGTEIFEPGELVRCRFPSEAIVTLDD